MGRKVPSKTDMLICRPVTSRSHSNSCRKNQFYLLALLPPIRQLSLCIFQGGPGSVRLRFGDGTVRAVPVFGSGGSSKEGVCVCLSTV